VTARTGSLLRVAGLPVTTWTAAGAPELFRLLGELAEETRCDQERNALLADAIGTRLVPHPAVSGPQRAVALRVRRALHNGEPAPATSIRVAELAERLLRTGDPLPDGLRAAVTHAERLSDLRTVALRSITDEEQRLLGLPWRLLHDSPVGRHALHDGDVALYTDIADRLDAGEPWTTKRMRQRSEYLWRMVTRGCTRATPRGWLAHVASLDIAATGGWQAGETLTLGDSAAPEYVGNVDQHHAEPVALLDHPDAVVALAPLTRLEPDHLQAFVLVGEHRERLGAVRLRRTPLVEQIRSALVAQPRAAARLVADVAADAGVNRGAVGTVVRHLVRVGVVQVCLPPRATLTRARLRDLAAPVTVDRAGFIDVYRETGAALADAHAERLQALVRLGLRVMLTTDLDGVDRSPPLPPGLGPAPRPLLDVVADCARSGVEVWHGFPHHHDWSRPPDPDSAAARLLDWIDRRIDRADRSGIDLDEATLDGLGTSPTRLDWPVDALLRPIRATGGPLAVLDEVAPAGTLDARFIATLGALGAPLPQVEQYRRFLDRYSERTGAPFVEVLVPPLAQQAANAVRRPGYTRRCTADPDRTLYFPAETAASTMYLPLSDITMRIAAGHVVAEVDGRPIWPISHTARNARPPWDLVTALLRLASPQPRRDAWRRLTYSLPAWPDRDHVPRITVGGGLVLTVAQWRLRRAQLWQPDASTLAKATALLRLRRQWDLPRWVTSVADRHDEPIAIDLDSLRAPRIIDRLLAGGGSALLLNEMLPGPEQLPVHDEPAGGSSVAELLLRLPTEPT
jgi:hypothetical protein